MIGYSICVKLNELKLIHEEQISKYNDKIITIWEDNAKCIVLCMLYNKTQKYYMIFKNTYKCTCKCVQKIKNMYAKFVIVFILRHKWLDMEGETSNVSIICVNDLLYVYAYRMISFLLQFKIKYIKNTYSIDLFWFIK